MSTPKILVVGAVQGHCEKAFQKISKLHGKQNFSFAIIVGDLFASDTSEQSEIELKSLLNGSTKVPLPTYFTIGSHSLPDSVQEKLESTGEVCNNLLFLGRKGTLKTAEGIRIVNLGGRLVQNEASVTKSIGKYEPLYLETEAKSLYGAHSADILITSDWPSNITNNSQVPVPESIESTTGTQAVSNLCLALRPRYHFSTSPSAAWSREPFMHPSSFPGRKLTSYEDLDEPAVTRFSSLASVETSNKEWMSAFTLDPSKAASVEGAQQTCPLTVSSPKRKRPTDDGSNGYSRYSVDKNHNRPHGDRRHSNKRTKFDQSSCFMCMSNPDFEATMVVSIAEESILTVLKGPLPIRSTTFPQLKSSGHIMIIPMYHAADEAAHGKRTLRDLQTEFTEMTKYRHALYKMIGSKGRGDLGAVCWEVNRTGIRHLHWQLIATPIDKLKTGLVEAAYKVAAEKAQYPHFQSCDPDELISDQRSDFFRVWIWQPSSSIDTENDIKSKTPAEKAELIANGHDEGEQQQTPSIHGSNGEEKSLFFPIAPNLRFNISFGREVMAGLLQLEDRTDWRSVESGNGVEEADATAFKEDFENWDWAMLE